MFFLNRNYSDFSVGSSLVMAAGDGFKIIPRTVLVFIRRSTFLSDKRNFYIVLETVKVSLSTRKKSGKY